MNIFMNISQPSILFDLNPFMTVSPSSMENIPVFLCTLSMLSNPFLSKFTRMNPLHTLVIDEASQIEMGDYLPVLLAGQKSLRKMCFIGDDHQLPPYGTDENKGLKSIFEVDHFSEALMLDTQYRMPPQVGNVISKLVYNNELKSFNGHPIKQETPACFFYHANGYEKTSGSSFINEAECAAVLKLAAYLAESDLEYKIITPYDGQRNFIEQQMKEEEMEWGNKCFNVDSFQGLYHIF
ncbi:P-loop containing nucleoside triphosphate hydrolase protein [Flagelloscypha sp. PMI_526]|nr:P-loop containing nucleoside triphosphate hydrolase protein [Flagelloscypha sp. PMI_526]